MCDVREWRSGEIGISCLLSRHIMQKGGKSRLRLLTKFETLPLMTPAQPPPCQGAELRRICSLPCEGEGRGVELEPEGLSSNASEIREW